MNSTGVSEPVVTTQGSDRIVVELPGVVRTEAVRKLVGQTGRLDFVPLGTTQKTAGDTVDETQFPPLFSGTELSSAAIGNDQHGGRVVTSCSRTTGAKLFGEYTAGHIGQYFAIVLDSKVISAPVIQSAIPGGNVQISRRPSAATRSRRRRTSSRSSSSARCRSRSRSCRRSGSARRSGEQFFSQSLLAGAVGILLVILFMLIYYRLPGIVASFALVYYTLVV